MSPCFVPVRLSTLPYLLKQCITVFYKNQTILSTTTQFFLQLFTHPLSKHANLPRFYSKILCETEHLISVTLSVDEDDRSDIRHVISSS